MIALAVIAYIVAGIVVARVVHHTKAIPGCDDPTVLGVVALVWPGWLLYVVGTIIANILGRAAGGRS